MLISCCLQGSKSLAHLNRAKHTLKVEYLGRTGRVGRFFSWYFLRVRGQDKPHKHDELTVSSPGVLHKPEQVTWKNSASVEQEPLVRATTLLQDEKCGCVISITRKK